MVYIFEMECEFEFIMDLGNFKKVFWNEIGMFRRVDFSEEYINVVLKFVKFENFYMVVFDFGNGVGLVVFFYF